MKPIRKKNNKKNQPILLNDLIPAQFLWADVSPQLAICLLPQQCDVSMYISTQLYFGKEFELIALNSKGLNKLSNTR